MDLRSKARVNIFILEEQVHVHLLWLGGKLSHVFGWWMYADAIRAR